MNKKIIFLILILLSVFIELNVFVEVQAAGISINGKYHNISGDISGDGFYYNTSTNTLELDNYNGGVISTLNDLNISIKGNNYVTGSSTSSIVKAKALVIDGEGTLNLEAPGIALYADSITIKNITVKGTSGTEFVSVTNNFVLDNVNMDAESGTTLLYGGRDNRINDSVIKSSNMWGLRYAKDGNTIIENSDIIMECSSICINSVATLKFNNTNAMFHGNTYASANITLEFGDDTTFMVSTDGIDYKESSNYNNSKYLKITGKVEDDDKNDEPDDNLNGDSSNDSDNNDNDTSSKDDNNTDNNQNDSSNGDVNDSNDGGVSDNVNDNDSEEKDDSNTNTGSDLDNDKDTNSDDKLDNDKEDSDNKDNSSNNNDSDNKDNSDLSNDNLEQDNDSSNDSNNDLNQGNGNIDEDDVYTENEYGDIDNVYTENEFDNDWTIEVENPKTYDGIGYVVFWLTFSLAGIIALVIVMRYLNGKI